MVNKIDKKKLIVVCLIVLALILVSRIMDNSAAPNAAPGPQPDAQNVAGLQTLPPTEAPAVQASAAQPEQEPEPEQAPEAAPEDALPDGLPVYGESYYDVENVVLYLELYNELPPNYITKREAQALGWAGGSVEDYKDGAAIGGDSFGNREGLLPTAKGRRYTECDIDTDGYSSRGSRRLVFSNDGLYFYTSDHYEHFSEVTVTEGYEVKW